MPRRNRRRKTRKGLGFDPGKYTGAAFIPGKGKGNYKLCRSRHGLHTTDTVHSRRPAKAVHRGEVWFADLGTHPGTSVIEGMRPVIVISNDKANENSEAVTVIPMTTKMKKYYLPVHVPVEPDDLEKRNPVNDFRGSMMQAEQITTISRTAFTNYLGRIGSEEKMREIEDAVMRQLGILSAPAFVDADTDAVPGGSDLEVSTDPAGSSHQEGSSDPAGRTDPAAHTAIESEETV